MNIKIAALREAIVKTTNMLAGSKIKVTQQGIDAFVESDRSGKPIRVNLPYIPDTASEELIIAIQGFLDHEVAHLLFTDWDWRMKASKQGKAISNLHNIIEDTMIERHMGKAFKGSKKNFEQLYGFMVEEMFDPTLAEAKAHGEEQDVLGPLMVPMFRAWSGQSFFQDYMEDKWDLPAVAEMTEKIGEDLIGELAKVETTEQALDLTLKIHKRITEEPEEPGEPGGSGDKSDTKSDTSSKSKSGDAPKKDDEPGSESSIPGDKEATGDDEARGGGEDKSKSDKEISGETKGAPSVIKDFEKALEDAEDFGEMAKKLVSTEDAMKAADYRVFTKDFDKVEKAPSSKSSSTASNTARMEEETRQMVGVMQKDLERMMQAQSVSRRIPGRRQGTLHSAALSRVAVGDDRVFRRREVHDNKDVAVSLLVDCSGSMRGKSFDLATTAAFALSQTLERIKIPHEVIGFTTVGFERMGGPETAKAALRTQEGRMGRNFSRFEPIYMPIFRGFDERLSSEVKSRFSHSKRNMDLANNIDGECVEIAALRLLTRRETRKVLMVLSDGSPSAAGNTSDQSRHLTNVIKDCGKRGVEAIGIGILSSAVENYYPKNVVLNSLSDLPGQVMKELRSILVK